MWVKTTTKRELIDILQSERSSEPRNALFSRYDFSAVSSLSSVYNRGELLLVWHDDPRDVLSLPSAIITEPREQQDFFAWAQTYLQSLRPLTAYVRVSDYDAAERAFKIQALPTLHRLENACIGLILGETATYLNGHRDLSQISVRACAGTYSFVQARALALGMLPMESDLITDTWLHARELTRQSGLSLSRTALLAPWHVLLGLESSAWPYATADMAVPESILDACSDLFLKGELDSRRLYALDSEIPGISDLAERIRGPREDRVLALERMAENLRTRSAGGNPITLAFAVGYLASQVGPGTLDHLHLLKPYLNLFPGVLLWYGLCAGLHGKSTVASHAGGLGRRVLRDLLLKETFLDKPTCDIAISELRVMTTKFRGSPEFLTNSHSQLEVEIVPCVKTVMRWPPRSDPSDSMFALTTNAIEEIRELQVDLADASEVIRDVSQRLSMLVGGPLGKRSKPDRKQRRH